MKTSKSYVIWIPKNDSRKSRQFLVGPVYLVALSIALVVCVLLIPFLQNHIFTLNEKIINLENNSLLLKSEISNLRYLKQNLTRLENKDRQLSRYFGIDNKPETLDGLLGKGGSPDTSDYSDYEVNTGTYPADSNLPIHLDTLESKFNKFEKLLITKEIIQDWTPNIIPLEKKGTHLSSGFGWRENPFTKKKEFHAALDIAGNTGTKIIAPANGIVLKTGHDKRLGYFIVLEHSTQIKTIYGHLSSILVKEGEEVSRGKKIGLMGNSGLSTSSHLHYMVVKDDRAVNPLEYILDVSENR
jgi:murein DD-endopeptidase MepM/ murein hydrolase activator NlpD